MAWTAPKTWAEPEVVTAAMLNAHLRDNIAVLKVPFADSGKVAALSSSYVADLDGTNLTGLLKLGAANVMTAGVHNLSAAYWRIPVGTDKYDGTSGNKTAGSQWIEGEYFHHVASDQNEWRYLGTATGASPGVSYSGCCWVEGGNLHYIDADGDERYCLGTTSGMHGDTNAQYGSFWTETYNHWIAQTAHTEYSGHSDVSHGDGTSHTDNPHSDYTDHTDTPGHTDTHTDNYYDSYSDWTDDWYYDHWDSHTDTHYDYHGDWTDYTDEGGHYDHTDSHSDHTDTPADARPELVGLT